MAKPLRVGVAGLGVVGSALARLLSRLGPDLAARTGRDISIVAVSARSMRDRGLGLGEVAFFADPRELAADGEIDMGLRVRRQSALAIDSAPGSVRALSVTLRRVSRNSFLCSSRP